MLGKFMNILSGEEAGEPGLGRSAQDQDAMGRPAPVPARQVGCSPLQGLCAILCTVVANLSPGGLDVALVGGRQHHGGFSLSLGQDQKRAGLGVREPLCLGLEGHARSCCAHWLARSQEVPAWKAWSREGAGVLESQAGPTQSCLELPRSSSLGPSLFLLLWVWDLTHVSEPPKPTGTRVCPQLG